MVADVAASGRRLSRLEVQRARALKFGSVCDRQASGGVEDHLFNPRSLSRLHGSEGTRSSAVPTAAVPEPLANTGSALIAATSEDGKRAPRERGNEAEFWLSMMDDAWNGLQDPAPAVVTGNNRLPIADGCTTALRVRRGLRTLSRNQLRKWSQISVGAVAMAISSQDTPGKPHRRLRLKRPLDASTPAQKAAAPFRRRMRMKTTPASSSGGLAAFAEAIAGKKRKVGISDAISAAGG
eukprot:gnl/TRDRNA2_/TRDRNA2_180592_c0_seq1.p1 gnl/TRDRNA2_/TRDRNA2_180592_c0~~gnl/TRDRNA2_/TRDRNA2_180592_c0_seq1.p1  ORF type:complete len:238 (+),score=39.47 gnl/TRDRNA2_/TRDRNA2_180592_c0_seq1:58-771(+)